MHIVYTVVYSDEYSSVVIFFEYWPSPRSSRISWILRTPPSRSFFHPSSNGITACDIDMRCVPVLVCGPRGGGVGE